MAHERLEDEIAAPVQAAGLDRQLHKNTLTHILTVCTVFSIDRTYGLRLRCRHEGGSTGPAH
jgi:hypothetical protein